MLQEPWTNVRFENASVILNEKSAIAMGNYFFTETNGNEVKVEYTLTGNATGLDIYLQEM